ncbi:MAG: DnaJ domain-containing protein [Imperialibacter sp.]
MSNYYLTILELETGATKNDIKKAYRRLSKKYHPDLNKSPEAHQKFIELTEAYTFLNQIGPRPHHEPVAYDYNPEVDEYELWREKAKAKARYKAKEEAKMQRELIKRIFNLFRKYAIGLIVFNLLLIVDISMPYHDSDQTVTYKSPTFDVKTGKVRRASPTYDIIGFDDYMLTVDKGKSENIRIGQKAKVRSTFMFDKPLKAGFVVNGRHYQVKQVYNVYIVFWILIPLTFLILFLFQYRFKTLDTKLTLVIFMGFISCYQLYLFFYV